MEKDHGKGTGCPLIQPGWNWLRLLLDIEQKIDLGSQLMQPCWSLFWLREQQKGGFVPAYGSAHEQRSTDTNRNVMFENLFIIAWTSAMPHKVRAPFPRVVLDRSRSKRVGWMREGAGRKAVHGEEQPRLREGRKLLTPSSRALVIFFKEIENVQSPSSRILVHWWL